MFNKIRNGIAKAISTDNAPMTQRRMLDIVGFNNPQNVDGVIFDEMFLEKLIRDSGYARMLVTVPVEDAIRNWRRWTGDEEQNLLIEETERRLRVQEIYGSALIYARSYGGCAILIGVEGLGDFNEPLDPTKVTADNFKYLQIIPQTRFSISQIDTRIGSPTNGQPMAYRLNPTAVSNINGEEDNTPEIHHTRLVIIKGDYTPSPYGTDDVKGFWGYSILQALYPALYAVNRANLNISGLIEVAQTPTLGVKGYREGLARKEITEAGIALEMSETDRLKSSFGTVIIDAEDTYKLNPVSFASLPQTNRELMIALSAQSGIPQSKLFSIQQAGLGDIGGSQRKDYQDLVRGIQVTKLQAPSILLDQCVINASLGGTNISGADEKEITYEWTDLETPTAEERAMTAVMSLKIITEAKNAGIIDEDQAREDYEKINPRTNENS